MPRGEQRQLDGVRCEVGVAEDPVRDRHAPIADRRDEGFEGFFVSLLRTLDER